MTLTFTTLSSRTIPRCGPTTWPTILRGHRRALLASSSTCSASARPTSTTLTQYNSGLNNLGGWALTLPAERISSPPILAARCRMPRSTCTASRYPPSGAVSSTPSTITRPMSICIRHTASTAANSAHVQILPSLETGEGGPTKQDLIFTGNILMGEFFSDHFDSDSPATSDARATQPASGVRSATSSTSSKANPPRRTMYQNAVNSIPSALSNLFGNDAS